MVSLGAPVKLQSVPYALFAMATPRVKGTNKNAEQDSPIFEVLNSKGTQVFGVYEGAYGLTSWKTMARVGQGAVLPWAPCASRECTTRQLPSTG